MNTKTMVTPLVESKAAKSKSGTKPPPPNYGEWENVRDQLPIGTLAGNVNNVCLCLCRCFVDMVLYRSLFCTLTFVIGLVLGFGLHHLFFFERFFFDYEEHLRLSSSNNLLRTLFEPFLKQHQITTTTKGCFQDPYDRNLWTKVERETLKGKKNWAITIRPKRENGKITSFKSYYRGILKTDKVKFTSWDSVLEEINRGNNNYDAAASSSSSSSTTTTTTTTTTINYGEWASVKDQLPIGKYKPVEM